MSDKLECLFQNELENPSVIIFYIFNIKVHSEGSFDTGKSSLLIWILSMTNKLECFFLV